MYINGVSVKIKSTSTSCTAITQAGNLQVGAYNGGTFIDGKICQVRVWSDIRSTTEIRDNMNQELAGSESGLVALFALDGDANDGTSNSNDLTGSGGAAATTVDNPLNDTEYAVITSVS